MLRLLILLFRLPADVDENRHLRRFRARENYQRSVGDDDG